MLENFRERILNFFFPTTCLFCGLGNKIICLKCFSDIPISARDKNNILSVYEYRNKKVNKLLWQLKYKHTHKVAEIFGQSLAENFKKWLQDFSNIEKIILIPVPLNLRDKRLNNHAELIAREFSKNFFPPPEVFVIPNLLIKNSEKKQAHSGRKKNRIENVENTISINVLHSSPFQGEVGWGSSKNNLFVIVDDITTTGATIGNIRNVLSEYLKIPEENILGLTIAH